MVECTGLLFTKEDLSVFKVMNPTDIDGRSVQHLIERGDILCFIRDQPVKKACSEYTLKALCSLKSNVSGMLQIRCPGMLSSI